MAEPASKRILVVDDASLVRRYYRDALERAGFEVDEALERPRGAGEAAGRAVRPADRRRQHAADGRLHLPQGAAPPGRAGVARCRRWSPAPRRAPQDVGAARAAGANFYLVKPVSQEALVEHVADHVRAAGDERVRRTVPDRRPRAGRARATTTCWRWRSDPDDRERLDGAFRAFHTLKGAAGIVDFVAMGAPCTPPRTCCRPSASGSAPVTAALIDLCLACLDQVVHWLDPMQASGEHAGRCRCRGGRLVRRFAELGGSRCGRPAAARQTRRAGAAIDGLTPVGRAASSRRRSLLLAEHHGEVSPGRLASAGRVAANVLRHHGLGRCGDDLESLLQSQPARRRCRKALAARSTGS